MRNSNVPSLSFFKVNKYEYKNSHVCDFSDCPRPHYCMGLLLEGNAVFESGGEKTEIEPGDIIFVPITSRYVSRWKGEKIAYISMHFSFEAGNTLLRNAKINIQKVKLDNFDELKILFSKALNCCDGEDFECLCALSCFYDVMSRVLEKLKYSDKKIADERIEKAMEYIELNYDSDFDVKTLSEICHMSESHFYSCFKKNAGMSPIEYRMKLRAEHAALLLIGSRDKTIEEISAATGFDSSAYFRKVFKKFMGKSPRDYRKTSVEI